MSGYARLQKTLAAALPVIVLDCDGVLANLARVALTAVNLRFGTAYRYVDCTDYWLGDTLTPAQRDYLQGLFATPAIYANLAPDPVAVAVARQAAAEGRAVWVATDRPAAAGDVTAAWLAEAGVPHERLCVGPGAKDALAGEARGTLFVDDNPYKVADLAGTGAGLVLLRRPWTPTTLPGTAICADWGQVCAALGVGRPAAIPGLDHEHPADTGG